MLTKPMNVSRILKASSNACWTKATSEDRALAMGCDDGGGSEVRYEFLAGRAEALGFLKASAWCFHYAPSSYWTLIRRGYVGDDDACLPF